MILKVSKKTRETGYSHCNSSIMMQRILSSSGLAIHVLVGLLPVDFVEGVFDSFGFGSELGVDWHLCLGWMVVRGVAHCFVFGDPDRQLPMHVVMHGVLIHVVLELETGEGVVARSVEMRSSVGSVDCLLVRDGLLVAIVACILVNVHIDQLLVGPRCASEY